MEKFNKALKIGRIFRYAMILMVLIGVSMAYAQGAEVGAEEVEVARAAVNPAIYYAIAIAIGMGCLSASLAVGKIGAAVMGAAAEKPEVLGKAIAYVGLGEGIALFGFLISMFLIFKI